MSRTRTREFLLVLVAVSITIVMAEFIARMFDIRPYQTRLERYQFDETLGWATRKSYATYISKRRYAHQLYYDQDGFPSGKEAVDDSISRERPSIALIGDSFVEGYYLPHEQTLAHHLAESTGKQVLNLGVSGYSPGQYLLSARRHLDRYNVTDIVVFLFAFNDIPYVSRTTYRGYAKPLVSDDSFEAVNVPLAKLSGNEAEVRGVVRNILDQFALWSLIKPLFVFLGQEDGVVLEPARLDAAGLERALSLIGRIRSENPDTSFHVYYIPDLTELKARDVYAHNVSGFEESCRRLELDCITPDPLNVRDPDSLYIPEDRHFSALGARMVAEQIGALLDPLRESRFSAAR